MGLKKSVAIITIITLVCLAVSIADTPKKCREDSDCMKDKYCWDGFCDGACIPCQRYFRQKSTMPRDCAKSEKQCGDCFEGHYAPELTGMNVDFRCSPKIKTEDQPNSSVRLTNSLFQHPALIVFAMVPVSYSLGRFYNYYPAL